MFVENHCKTGFSSGIMDYKLKSKLFFTVLLNENRALPRFICGKLRLLCFGAIYSSIIYAFKGFLWHRNIEFLPLNKSFVVYSMHSILLNFLYEPDQQNTELVFANDKYGLQSFNNGEF